jgi:MFS family permease
MWYKRGERTYRIALFFSAASLAGAFGGILAYVSLSILILVLEQSRRDGFTDQKLQGIGFMRGTAGKNGWAWIFIIVSLFLSPDLLYKYADHECHRRV